MTQMFTTKTITPFSECEEIDNLSRSFNRQLLSADCYQSCISNSLINTTRRYISTKLKYEDNSIDFIQEIRRKLYLIHEYNVEIFKLTNKYPRIRNFDLLLIKYVELEYQVLYCKHKIDGNVENEVVQRIFRLLYIILQYCTSDDEFLTKTGDITIKVAMLQLFVGIKFEYYKEERFLYNLTRKLIDDIGAKCDISTCNSLFHYLKANFSTARNTTTSDYGSEDSDIDEMNSPVDLSLCTNTQIRPIEINVLNVKNTNEIEEVPVTKNGLQPLVTFELINDDDDDYMVYLTEKHDNHQSDNPAIINNSDDNNKENNTSVTISSDSENDCVRIKTKKRLKKQQKRSVVTFEIVDNDDDTNSYMVYLGKEVESRNKRQKLTDNPIILSDSEDDSGNIKNIKTETNGGINENSPNISNPMKIEAEEIDLKIDIIEKQERIDSIYNKNESDMFPADPCLNMVPIDSSLIVPNISNLGNLIEYNLNGNCLEEMQETSYLSKKDLEDFEDLQYFLFDTNGQHSFSRYCEQLSDNDDNYGISDTTTQQI